MHLNLSGKIFSIKKLLKNKDEIISLNLYNTGLDIFPQIIFEMPNLKTLDIAYNNISVLPDLFHKIINLS